MTHDRDPRENRASIVTYILPADYEAGCACGARGRISRLACGWVIHPEEYDPCAIAAHDVAHDHAMRAVSDEDARAIVAAIIGRALFGAEVFA